MKSFFLLTFALCLVSSAFCQDPVPVEQSDDGRISWFNALDLGLTGRAWDETEHPYDRLPSKAKGLVRDEVWMLGTNTAGISVHFSTNPGKIWARWVVRYDKHMNHMADCGTKGIDLYIDELSGWIYAGTGRPSGKKSESLLLEDMDGRSHRYHINLPLYDGIDTLWIGIEQGADIQSECLCGKKPLVIYGTSIQQGGCASRPGMAASNILSRMLNREVINLGFSGNGRMEMELAELISEIDAAGYIFDCLPNLHDLDVIYERYTDFIRLVRARRPEVPIFLVETATTVKSEFKREDLEQLNRQNEELRRAWKDLSREGLDKIYLIDNYDLIGPDGEGTVDGVHYTDLGFFRYAGKVGRFVAKKIR